MNAPQVAERRAVYALEDAVAPVAGEAFDLLATAPQGVAKLRELILSLAVKGKLVPQVITDQPASALVAKIGTARAKLATAKRSRIHKSMSSVVDGEVPFALPRGWTWTCLGEIGEWGAGATPLRSKAEYYGGDIPWFKSGELRSDFIEESEETITPLALNECSLRENRAGDVLVAMYGATIGKVSILAKPATTNQAVCACTPYSGISNRYLSLLLKTLRSYFVRIGAGAAQPNISREKIVATVIALPPSSEQHRIVARVEELMGLCDELETRGRLQDEQHARLVATLFDALVASASPAELADNWQRVARHFDLLLDRPEAVDALEQTILQLAVRGLLVNRSVSEGTGVNAQDADGKSSEAPDLPIPYELPASWRLVTADDVCTAITDGEHQTPHRVPDHKAVPLVTAKNVRDEHFDLDRTDFVARATAEKCWERCKPRPGDILMVSVGATLGRLAILRTPVDMVLVRSVTVLRPDESLVCSDYLALHLRSPQTQRDIWRSVKQSAQPCLYLGRSKQLRLAIPPLAEQHRIVARVEALRGLCADLRQHLQQAQTTQSNLADALVATIMHDRASASV